MFQPLQADVLASLVLRQSVQIGHEDLQSSFWSHAAVAVHQLILIVVEIEIKPRVIREIYHDQIHVMHGKLPEIDRAVI